MANNAGTSALLSGLAGGLSTGQQAQQLMKPNGLGLPGQSATGAQGLPQTQPAAPSTPDTKAAATQAGGTWGTLSGYINQG